jgi:TonB family protein
MSLRIALRNRKALAAGAAAAALAIFIVFSAPAARVQSPSPSAPDDLPGEPPAHPTRITIDGNNMAARVLKIALPSYPKDLQDAHVAGTVILRAVIGKDGTMARVDALSGPQQLWRVTTDAVKRWRFQPTVVEGVPVEVSTTISIDFAPGRAPRYAQQGAAMPQTAEAMDPQLRADILRLIDATHLRKTMRDYGRQMMETMRPSIEDSLPETANRKEILGEVEQKMTAALQSDAATDQIIMVYAKYLTDDDARSVAAFYESPAGQRFNSISVQMEDDLSQSGEQFAMENLDLILKGLCASHPELRGKADFCRQNSHQRSAFQAPRAPGSPIGARPRPLGGN